MNIAVEEAACIGDSVTEVGHRLHVPLLRRQLPIPCWINRASF